MNTFPSKGLFVLILAHSYRVCSFSGRLHVLLTKDEWRELITICDNLPEGVKYSPATPFAFTEQGVAMLSSVLNSDRAVAVNIQIMRIFTRMRQLLLDNTEVKLEIAEIKYPVQQIAKKQEGHNQNIEIFFLITSIVLFAVCLH